MLGFFSGYMALWALVLFQGLLLVPVLRHISELRKIIAGGGVSDEDWLPIGTPAPNFVRVDANSGEPVTTRDFLRAGGVILFLSSDCSVCKSLAASFQYSPPEGLPTVIALCRGERQSCTTALNWRTGFSFISEGVEEIAAQYRVSGFPTAVVIDNVLKVRGYGYPRDAEDIKRLFNNRLADTSPEESAMQLASSR